MISRTTALLLVVCSQTSAHGQTLDELLQQHRVGVELVASVSCSYRYYAVFQPDVPTQSGRYHRDNRGVVVERSDTVEGLQPKIVIRGGVRHSLARVNDTKGIQWRVAIDPVSPDRRALNGDVYDETLLNLSGDGGRATGPVAEFCEARKSGLQGIRTEVASGTTYKVVTIKYQYDK